MRSAGKYFQTWLIVLLVCGFIFQICYAQKSKVLLDHYQIEQNSWIEKIQKSSISNSQNNFDALFYHIKLDVKIASPYIQGSVLCRVKPTVNDLSQIKLNLHNSFSIERIKGNISSFILENDTLYINFSSPIKLNEIIEFEVFYKGVPELAGGYKGLRYEQHGLNEPIIATLSTPYLAHYWWPCKDGPGDKPDSVYIDITIPDTTIQSIPLIAVSNGVLENVITISNKRTFQWRERNPIVPYYVMMAISNYKKFSQSFVGKNGEQFPIDYYVFEDHLTTAQKGVEQLPEVMEFFISKFGSYPFANEKYGMTQLGFYGAIENQTNTIQNNMSPTWLPVSIHELAHMWFGDMITCENWHHGWLNEGFATYSEALWAEHSSGFDAYKQNIESNRYEFGGTVYLQNAGDPFNVFVNIIYTKGAYVLHMLRGILGDEVFFDCLYQYANDARFRYYHATTEDFKQVCESVSKVDLDFFFDQWIYDEYYPMYQYEFNQNKISYETTLSIKQIQSENGWREIFEMPIQLEFKYADGSDTLITVWNETKESIYNLKLEKEIAEMNFDPDNWILHSADLVGIKESDFVINTKLTIDNFPNPFNNSTKIEYNLPTESKVKIEVLDVLGRSINVLVDEKQSPGLKTVFWDGKNKSGNTLSSGIYICKIKTENEFKTIKMLLIK